MKTLILGTTYISAAQEGAQNYPLKLVQLWARLNAHLCPDTDMLLVDSHSPVDLMGALEGIAPRLKIHDMRDNVGHLNSTGKDGWGRAFCWGVQHAIQQHYDYIAYCDADIICTVPATRVIERMAKANVNAACPWNTMYDFAENGLMYLSVPYLRDSGFVERYDWQNRTRSPNPRDIPERVFEDLMGDDLWILPMRGMRNDLDQLTVNNFAHRWPYGGPSWLTHCRDIRLYDLMLEKAGIKL